MNREEILNQLWAEQDKAFDLMAEYDSIPHHYGNDVLYQAEAYIIHEIGNHPNITTTEIAENLHRTPSACSQVIKKLIKKGLVIQTRNEDNKRMYNLTLTPNGQKVYLDHIEFNLACQKSTFELLSGFTDEELAIHAKVQAAINEAYQGDVDRSRIRYGTEN